MPSQFTDRRSRKRDTFETCDAIIRYGTSDFTSRYRYRRDEVAAVAPIQLTESTTVANMVWVGRAEHRYPMT